jgi:hypothetical protein
MWKKSCHSLNANRPVRLDASNIAAHAVVNGMRAFVDEGRVHPKTQRLRAPIWVSMALFFLPAASRSRPSTLFFLTWRDLRCARFEALLILGSVWSFCRRPANACMSAPEMGIRNS